jgi:hypothetical protein
VIIPLERVMVEQFFKVNGALLAEKFDKRNSVFGKHMVAV